MRNEAAARPILCAHGHRWPRFPYLLGQILLVSSFGKPFEIPLKARRAVQAESFFEPGEGLGESGQRDVHSKSKQGFVFPSRMLLGGGADSDRCYCRSELGMTGCSDVFIF